MSYIILIPAVLHLYRLLLSCIRQLYWWQRLFGFNLLLWHQASRLQLLDSWRFRLKWPQLIYLKWLIFMLIPKFAFYCSSLFFNNLPCSECEEESKSREIYLITLQPPATCDVVSVPKIDSVAFTCMQRSQFFAQYRNEIDVPTHGCTCKLVCGEL